MIAPKGGWAEDFAKSAIARIEHWIRRELQTEFHDWHPGRATPTDEELAAWAKENGYRVTLVNGATGEAAILQHGAKTISRYNVEAGRKERA